MPQLRSGPRLRPHRQHRLGIARENNRFLANANRESDPRNESLSTANLKLGGPQFFSPQRSAEKKREDEMTI